MTYYKGEPAFCRLSFHCKNDDVSEQNSTRKIPYTTSSHATKLFKTEEPGNTQNR